MHSPIVILMTMAAYLGVGAWLWRHLVAGEEARLGARPAVLALGAVGVVLHAGLLSASTLSSAGLNLGFTNAVSLVALVIAALFLAVSLRKPIDALGVFILPLAAITVLIEWLWPSYYAAIPYSSKLLFAHIIVSLLAYSLLSVAVVQSLALSIQERRLRARQTGPFLRALPPLETMEALMFQLIALGFLLLTLTLVSGIFFSEQIFGKPLMFTHHIVLSIFAWVVFAALLFGRARFGWRGRHAVRWALTGFTLLVLAYFGSKFVFEILLSPGR